jgi:hypothetical protein
MPEMGETLETQNLRQADHSRSVRADALPQFTSCGIGREAGVLGYVLNKRLLLGAEAVVGTKEPLEKRQHPARQPLYLPNQGQITFLD